MVGEIVAKSAATTPRRIVVNLEARAKPVTNTTPKTLEITILSAPQISTPESDTTRKWNPGPTMETAILFDTCANERRRRGNFLLRWKTKKPPDDACTTA